MTPLVTIGIPTFNRPELLARTLAAVARQDYPNLEVIVSDNATPGEATARVVESAAAAILRLTYVRQKQSLGARGNFMFLLGAATGRYFMWLADDDEISPNYVSSLVDLLESDPGSSCAAGRWVLMTSEHDGSLMPTSSYPEQSAVARALRFVWRSDDAFFYALHRTEVLRRATFRGYSWPNRSVLSNWAYVYLLDVVLSGRVLIARDPSVRFINHDYTTKSYRIARGRLSGRLAYLCLRLNVHLLYWEKCARRLSPLALPLVVVTSFLALFREGGSLLRRRSSESTGVLP